MMPFLMELSDQKSLVLEIKKYVLIYLSQFMKFAKKKKKKKNLMFNLPFLLFLTSKTFMNSVPIHNIHNKT